MGFGAWGIGGDAYGFVAPEQALAAIEAALKLGITFFDTADLYGAGQSESLIGEALKDRRDHAVIATKTGCLEHDGLQDFSPRHVKRGVEASLRRLRTRHLDLLLLHSPPPDVFDRERGLLTALVQLKEQGLTKAIGVSCKSPAHARGFLQIRELDALEMNLNLIDHRAIDLGVLDECMERRVGVIARTPFAFGFLTGRYVPGVEFPAHDHRSMWPQEQLDTWARAPAVFAPLNSGKDRSLADLALLFCLSHPAVTSVIPGMLTADEAQANARAGQMSPLSEEETLKIRTLYSENEFFVRPRRIP